MYLAFSSQNTETPDVTPSNSSNILDRPFELEEILNALKKMKTNKAAGIDGLPAEFWKFGNVHEILLDIFESINRFNTVPDHWKTAVIVPIHKKNDVNDPANYRGISLLTSISKVYCSILNTRLLKWADQHAFFTDSQNGFRPKRSTIDSLFTLHTAVTSELSHGRVVYCALIDFLKCFDSIPRNLLFAKLQNFGISERFIEKLKSVYHEIRAQVRFGSQMLTRSFTCPSGVRQGCIMSSTLFSYYLNELEEFLIANDVNSLPLADKRLIVLLFADDLALVDVTIKGLQRKLNLLAEYCRKWGIYVNTDKSKIMVFKNGRNLVSPYTWNYNGQLVEIVPKFEYLGLSLGSSNSLTPTINDRIAKTKRAMGAIFGSLKRFHDIPANVLIKILDTKIIPVLTYGSEIWGLCDLTNVETVINGFYKIVLNLPCNCSNDLARGELGRHSLRPIIWRNVIKYWLKLLNSEPGMAIHEAYRLQYHMAEKGKNCWGLRLKQMLFSYGFGNAWTGQSNLNGKLFINEFYTSCLDIDIQEWHSNVCNFGILRNYRKFKESLTFEPYLRLALPRSVKTIFTKLRGGLLHIEANVGRWAPLYKNYDERLCPLCNFKVVEDEVHVLFYCPVWACYRYQLFDYPYFKLRDLRQLCNSSNKKLIEETVKFLKLIIFERNEILEVL